MTNFEQTISQSKPTLVDFYARWCGPCQMQAPIIDKIKADYGDKLNVLKIDVEHDRELAAVYRVSAIPTLVLFKDGRTVWRASGLRSAADIEGKIKEML
ncbi:MAG: thioredoxin [Muribaculaceae bacterium]|nr:thioredoxin [Muribaculaceae bacterium]